MIMKIKKLLKIFGLSILAGNIMNAEYIKKMEKFIIGTGAKKSQEY